MGRWIDRAMLLTLAALALYLLFLQAFGNILLSALLAFLCCILWIQAQKKGCGRTRISRFQARMILESWACEPDDAAKEQIEKLGRHSGKLVYLGRHPSATLSMGDVFSAWKSHRGEDALTLAAPCFADGRARTYAATRTNPRVHILDAGKLIPLIRRSGIAPPHAPMGRHFFLRLKEICLALPGRRPWYKRLATGLGLMLFYLLTGNVAYLILAVGMLFLAGVALRMRSA